jgi:hypothetical protein
MLQLQLSIQLGSGRIVLFARVARGQPAKPPPDVVHAAGHVGGASPPAGMFAVGTPSCLPLCISLLLCCEGAGHTSLLPGPKPLMTGPAIEVRGPSGHMFWGVYCGAVCCRTMDVVLPGESATSRWWLVVVGAWSLAAAAIT